MLYALLFKVITMRHLWLILLCLTTVCYADDNDYRYVAYYFQVQATDDSALSTAQCQQLFRLPHRYNIKDNQSIYQSLPDMPVVISHYQRLSSNTLSKQHILYTGKSDVVMTLGGQIMQASMQKSFVLNMDMSQIQGDFLVPGYCKGKFIGVDTQV